MINSKIRKESDMRTLIDRLIILVAVIGFMCFKDSSTNGLIIVLLGISLAGVMYYVNDRKYGALIESTLSVIYAGITFINPMVVFVLPIILYECIYTKIDGKKAVIVCSILRTLAFAMCISAFVHIEVYNIFIVLVSCVVAIWMAIQTVRINGLEDNLIKTIDTDTEYQLELKRNNRMLIEKQDNEVYVATLKERNRIAREIHDNVGHMLVRGIMQCGAIITINKDEELDEHLKGLKETLDSSMTSIRNSVHDLHDDAIDLKFSVDTMVRELEGFNVDYEYDVESEVAGNIKYAIIAIVKEGITNIIKHSNGKNVKLMLREHPAFYQIVISDDGIVKNTNNKGIGLSNIKERVEMLGGSTVINTDGGFRIFANIPKK